MPFRTGTALHNLQDCRPRCWRAAAIKAPLKHGSVYHLVNIGEVYFGSTVTNSLGFPVTCGKPRISKGVKVLVLKPDMELWYHCGKPRAIVLLLNNIG